MFGVYRFFVGYFLLVLTVCSLFTLSVVFTSAAAQRNIAQLVPGSGGLISLEDVDRLAAQIDVLEREVSAQRAEVAQAELQLASQQTSAAGSADSGQPSNVTQEDEQLGRARKVVEVSDRQILALTQEFGGANFKRVIAELHAVQASGPFGIGLALMGMHPNFLSLLLALQMGGLGALLLVVSEYLRGPFSRDNGVTFASSIGRLVGGMGAAICLVTLAQSAVGALFTSIRVEGPDKGLLDSFTIAGIGLVGGFMGDGLAEGIRSRSLSFLKQPKST